MAEGWHKIYDQVKPYVVRINTENGFGTGFLLAYNKAHTVSAIATAAHVIQDAYEWEKPIKVFHYATGTTKLYRGKERVIFIDSDRDAATVLIPTTGLDFPKITLPLMDKNKFKKVGVEIGWVGFPSMFLSQLCFFSGNVSAFVKDQDYYLIDGVAINGVSGGPVFGRPLPDQLPDIIGIVSAYIPNKGISESLPGLLQAQDVTSFHAHIQKIESFDQAKEKEREQQAKADKVKAEPINT